MDIEFPKQTKNKVQLQHPQTKHFQTYTKDRVNLFFTIKNNLELGKITDIDYTKLLPYDSIMPTNELAAKCKENIDKKYKNIHRKLR